MEVLFILALSWLVTVKAGLDGARDWQLAKQGKLPPRVEVEIERLKTAGQLATDANIAPQQAFRVLRQSGTGWSAYWRRLRDDAFDTLRERHESRDERRREKRRQKREGTYEPGGAENLLHDVRDSVSGRVDRAFDAWVERRQERRRQANAQQNQQEPVPEPDPAVLDDSQSAQPQPIPEPISESEARPDPESEQQDPGPTAPTSPEQAQTAVGPDSIPTNTDTDTGQKETEQEDSMSNDATTANGQSSNGNQGGSGGEINSQRKLAVAELLIASISGELLSKSEAIAASADAHRLDTKEINRGIERLRLTQARWASAGEEHQKAAVAATEVVKTHEEHISADLDYDVAN